MEARSSTTGREGLLAGAFYGSSRGIALARFDDDRIVEANDAFLGFLGRPSADVVGSTIRQLGLWSRLGDDRAQDQLRERGVVEAFDASVQTSDGKTRAVRLWAEVVDISNERYVALHASDVEGHIPTGSRYQELLEAEVRYRTLLEQIPAITYTEVADETSPTGFRDIYISPQTFPVLGYTAEEWQTDSELWIKVTHPEDRDHVIEADQTASRSGERYLDEYRMIARDGRVVWFRDEAVYVEDPVTGLGFWQGVMLDITEQKRAEERLIELEAKYRTLVEQIPAVVYLGEYGTDGDWLYISPQIQRLLGYTPEEWLAHPHPMQSFTHPDDIAAVRAEEARSQREGDAFSAEYRMRARDGRWVWILDEATAVRDETGRPLVLQGTMFDVTERKRAEEELAEAVEKLRSLDRLKNTLLHTLSHDLRGPLTAILGAASTLERLGPSLPEDERNQILHTLADRTKAMNKLLTDLLDLDRLDQGILEPRRFPVDLAELARDAVARADALAGRNVVVEAARSSLNVDKAWIERILDNLLANAANHTPASACIWVRVSPYQTGALIEVDDDGPGVPDDMKETVFEAFRRGSSAESSPGSGIGLSLVARFAELHGGRAWVEDHPGGGASFRVFLPNVPTNVN